MAEIAMVTRRVNIGLESTPGQIAPRTTRLRSINWAFSPQFESRDFRATGDKYGTVVQPLREWTDFTAEGFLDYNEFIYPLASVVNYGTANPTIAGTSGTADPVQGTAYAWYFQSALDSADSPATYSAEVGDANSAQAAAYLLFNQLDITIAQNEAGFTAGGFAHRFIAGTTITPGTAIYQPDVQTMLPSQFTTYLDRSGTTTFPPSTKLTRNFNFGFSLSERYGMVWPIDSTLTSYAAHVELPADLTITLQVAADGTGLDALLADMRAGQTLFGRTVANGLPTFGTAYKFELDWAGEIMDAPSLDDFEGVHTAQWTLRGVYNPTFGKAFSMLLINEMSSL